MVRPRSCETWSAGRCALSERQRDADRRSGARLALHVDGAAMQPHQLMHQRKADAGAFHRAAALALDPVEPIEHPRQLVCGNADAGIADQQFRCAVIAGVHRDANAAFQRVLERVRHQVQHHAFPHVRIDIDGMRQLRAFDAQLQSGAFAGGPEVAGQFGGIGGEVGGTECGAHPARPRCARNPAACSPGATAATRCGAPSPAARPLRRRGAANCSSSGPSISVSGVRNSWLTLEKNAVLARSISASASARCRSAS